MPVRRETGSDMGALQDQTELNIRERGNGRKQKPHPEREDGHLRTMGGETF